MSNIIVEFSSTDYGKLDCSFVDSFHSNDSFPG